MVKLQKIDAEIAIKNKNIAWRGFSGVWHSNAAIL
jgi:hypothetical protein